MALKSDDFFTQMIDIASELSHYRNSFYGKVVFCNCNDSSQSKFWRYFHDSFEILGLKKLIATTYCENGPAYKLVYECGDDHNEDVCVETSLKGNGDFRSEECIEILKEADVIVTHPPFILFTEYVTQLVAHGKEFLIMGNKTAVTYPEIFSFIRNDKLWLGYSSGRTFLNVPIHIDTSTFPSSQYHAPTRMALFTNLCWFTNLDVPKRHIKIIPALTQKYDSALYPKYDNFDAIDVGAVAEIPVNFSGIMGVPISFISHYNPDEFEIVGFGKGNDGKVLCYHDGTKVVKSSRRVLIKRRAK